jgi:hypothetical protein
MSRKLLRVAAGVAVAAAVLLTGLEAVNREPATRGPAAPNLATAGSGSATAKTAAQQTPRPKAKDKTPDRKSSTDPTAKPKAKPKAKPTEGAANAPKPGSSTAAGALTTLRTQFTGSARTWAASLAAYKAAQKGDDWALREARMNALLKASVSFQRKVGDLRWPARLVDERKALLRDLKSLVAALRLGTAKVSLGDGLSPPTLISRAASRTAGSLRALKAGLAG